MEKLFVQENNVIDIVTQIKRDGICVIKSYVDKVLLKKIDTEFEKILNTHAKQKGLHKSIRTNVNSDIVNMQQNNNINTLFTSAFIITIANKVLDRWKYDNIFIHKDYKNQKTNNTYPHFDFDRKLKFYLCVNDMNKTNGCFKALAGKNSLVEEKRKINRRNNIFTPGHKLYNGTEIKLEELIPIECKGGDLIIFDTNCIHAGGDNFEEGKYRKVIRLHLSNK